MSELCAMCQRYFADPADLLAHRNSAHRDEDPTSSLLTNPEAHRPGVVCPRCGKRFPEHEALAEHILRHSGPTRRARSYRPTPG